MLIYTLFILTVATLLYMDYATNLKLTYKVSKVNINRLAIYFAFVLVVLFAGLRYEIGYDYPKYLAGFLFDSELRHWEPLFNFLTRVIREINFGLDSQALFLVFSFLTITILYQALKKYSQHYRLSLLLYLLIPALYLNTFSVVRQGIAMVILFYGLYYLTVKVNKRRYLLFGVLAFLFHYSSIFVVLTYVLFGRFFNRTYSWMVYTFAIGLSFALSLTHASKYILLSLPGKFSIYGTSEMEVSVLKIVIVNLFFFFLLFQKNQFVKTRLHRYLFNSLFLATFLLNVFSDFIYVTRIAQYFMIAEIILLPVYIYSFKTKWMQKTMMVLLLSYYMFNFSYAIYRDEHYIGGRPHFLVPYENYLFTETKSDKQKYQQQWIEFYQQIGLIK